MNFSVRSFRSVGAVIVTAGAVLSMQPAAAQTLAYGSTRHYSYPASVFEPVMPQGRASQAYAYAPAQQQQRDSIVPEPAETAADIPAHLRRQVVDYPTREAPGTIVIDTPNTYLYYVLGGGKAIRYGVGVGREGFTWSGVRAIERKTEWPDWLPPPEMIARQPYLPRWMAGGETNPLGARAMYIGGTLYRIHGTNAPSTIGHNVSSGCIRMLNADVIDLYDRAKIGTKVVVLPAGPRTAPVAAVRDHAPQATLATHRLGSMYFGSMY